MPGKTRVNRVALTRVQDRLKDRAKALEHGARIILEQEVENGAVDTQDLLEEAVTRTGIRRVESGAGQFPGRHDTGNMVGSIGYEVQKVSKIIWGWFGWFAGEFEPYFRDQDQGEGMIPAARALPRAFEEARQRVRRRLDHMVRTGEVDGD